LANIGDTGGMTGNLIAPFSPEYDLPTVVLDDSFRFLQVGCGFAGKSDT
jgi:hypothetical protein